MSYFDFFGLREHPFQVTPDSRFLYLSSSHARAKAYMDYSVWKKDGFVVITGEIGAGKTTLIHKLLSEIDDSATLIRIFQTQLDEIEFLQTMLIELGFPSSDCQTTSKVDLLNKLKNYLLEAARGGRHVVLVVDEAQNLNRKVLEEIRMLSTPDPGGDQVLNIILVGQPELRDTLGQPDMEQLAQRIRLRFHVGTLSDAETIEYIHHRLRVAGMEEANLFTDDALSEVFRYSGGVPRRINILCDTALICAFADGIRPVTGDIVREAVEELQWQPYEKIQRTRAETDVLRPWLKAGGAQQAAALRGPEFAGGDEHWSQMFSLVLSMMTDINQRMARLEQQMLGNADSGETVASAEAEKRNFQVVNAPHDRGETAPKRGGGDESAKR